MNTREATRQLGEALLQAQGDRDWEGEGRLIHLLARSEMPERPPLDDSLLGWFLSKIGFGLSECWYWTASLAGGYGQHGPRLGEARAHRLAFRLFKGPIPGDLCVMHICDVRNCVNPNHLVLGTQIENIADMNRKGRGRIGDHSGERNGRARLTREQVAEIRTLVADGAIQRQIAQSFAVSPSTISRVVREENW